MLKLFEFILHACWHEWTERELIDLYDDSGGRRPIGFRQVLQCKKCSRIKLKDHS